MEKNAVLTFIAAQICWNSVTKVVQKNILLELERESVCVININVSEIILANL